MADERRAARPVDGTASAIDWAPAMAYAVLGAVPDGLSPLTRPDVDALLIALAERQDEGSAALSVLVEERRRAGAWPHPVPAELTQGLGAAQWVGVLRALVSRFPTAETLPVAGGSGRALDRDERRLTADRPPHHGS